MECICRYNVCRQYYRDSTSGRRINTFNYSAGISYKAMSRFEINVGIGVSKLAEQINSRQAVYDMDTIIVARPRPNTTSGNPSLYDTTLLATRAYYDINGDSTGRILNMYSYFSIQGGITYYVYEGKKLRVGLSPSVAYNILSSSKGYAYAHADSTYKAIDEEKLRGSMISLSGAVNIEYRLIDNLRIELAPVYRTFIGSIYTPAYPLEQKYQQAGLQLFLRYYFK
jgi:hypothetical protein